MAKTEEERKAYNAAWWKKNRAKAAEYRKQWRLKNPERAREINSALKQKHADRIREYNRAYCRKNKDKVREWKKKYQDANRETYLDSCKRSHKKHPEIAINSKARRRHRIGSQRLSKGLTATLLIAQKNLCNHCKCSLLEATPHRDHIIPISKGGPNIDSNIQLLCRRCNQVKSDKILDTTT